MSYPKLYKHNETGKIVAAVYQQFTMNYTVLSWAGVGWLDTKEYFEKEYAPLPEAPEEGSTAWAVLMLGQGHKVTRKSFSKKNFWHLNKLGNIVNVEEQDCSIRRIHNDWQLYEEPKLIVEKFPHEFSSKECVLFRLSKESKWYKDLFLDYNITYEGMYCVQVLTQPIGAIYCIPFKGNEHLEGTVTDGEHGAVPKDYVPPHVPQLGDDDYWAKEDVIINLSNNIEAVISHVGEERVEIVLANGNFGTISIYGTVKEGLLRVWYHKGSFVKSDGTVHEHIPTRPYKITSQK